MAALTAARNTVQAGWDAYQNRLSYPVAASTKIYAGAMVALNAAGFAIPASATAIKVVGVAEATVDNTAGANAALSVSVRRGSFPFNNKAADLVTQADIAAPALCYVDDDNTVRHTATGSIAAGRPLGIDANGMVVVEII